MGGAAVTTAEATGTGAGAGEVVTSAHVNLVDLPGGTGRAALVTLDNGLDARRPTTLGPRGLDNLEAALTEVLDRDDLVAVALTGKPFVFCVGADLTVLRSGASREEALQIARQGHRVFALLRDSRIPTFALVNGPAMGGGLELALHCHHRAVSATAKPLALPECAIGLVPGWGGTQLLPRLVGPEAAVTVVLENPLSNNRTLSAPQALALGLVDAMFESADFLVQALRWVGDVVGGRVPVVRRAAATDAEWTAALARGQALVEARTHGFAPAPRRALELLALARTAEVAEGSAAEDAALADLVVSDEMRASLYAFDLVQKRARRPAGEPDRELARPVGEVGIVGAGRMAAQLALLAARQLQVPVLMTDLDQERVDAGLAQVAKDVAALEAKGKVSADEAQRVRSLVSGSTDRAAFATADVVIEAVFENLAVKQEVLRGLEQVVRPDCVLATNTSSLSVSAMASVLEHPERMLGLHFFNPVAVLPLLEVVRGERTDDATLATGFAVGRALRKSCVLVRDAPAFVFNRLLLRALSEVLAAIDRGTPFEVADAAVDELGMPMRPLALLRLVGPPVALHATETLHESFPGRFPVSPGLRALVAAGKPAVLREDGSVDPEVAEIWPRGDAPRSPEQVLDDVRVALAEEARRMLDEDVVSAPEDLDLCLILGGGWAFWNGGLTPYLDRTGVSEHVSGRRFLPPGVADVARGDSG